MISSPTVRELSFFPFNELHSVIKMSPPLISRPAAASFPPGEAGGWLRRVSPFNVPGLLSNLGREADSLPYSGGEFWMAPFNRARQNVIVSTAGTNRAGQGRGWIRKSPKGVSKKALLEIQPAVGFRPNHERLAFCRVFRYAVGERSRKKNKGGMNIWNRFISVSGLQPSGGSGG